MVGRGENAYEKNFSFSPSVFKRLVLQTHKNKGLFGKELKKAQIVDLFPKRRIVWKIENAGYNHFLLFPTMILKVFFHRVVKTRNCLV